jgi:hypothetical protein
MGLSMSACRAALSAAVGLFLVARSDAASAHAPPFGTDLLFADAEDERPLVLTNRGLLFPGPAGYALRCTLAYAASTAEDSHGLLTEDGRLLLQSASGVFVSADRGCTFTTPPGLPPATLASFAASQGRSRILTSTAGYSEAGQVFVSDDAAHGFRHLSTLPAQSDVETMLVAPSRAARVYACGKRLDGDSLREVWLVSDDGGESFAATDVLQRRRPVGVHPRNADLVFVAEPDDDASSMLLRSTDGGKSFQDVLRVPSVLALASSEDGTRMWLGTGVGRDGLRGGLFVSEDEGATFEAVRDELTAVTCLSARGSRLWLCGSVVPGIGGVWHQDGDAAPLVAHLRFDQVSTQVDCPGETDAADSGVCAQDFRDWLTEQLGSALDAGAGGDVAEGGAGLASPKAEHAHSGCAVRDGPPARCGPWPWLSLGLYGLHRVRRGKFCRPRGR